MTSQRNCHRITMRVHTQNSGSAQRYHHHRTTGSVSIGPLTASFTTKSHQQPHRDQATTVLQPHHPNGHTIQRQHHNEIALDYKCHHHNRTKKKPAQPRRTFQRHHNGPHPPNHKKKAAAASRTVPTHTPHITPSSQLNLLVQGEANDGARNIPRQCSPVPAVQPPHPLLPHGAHHNLSSRLSHRPRRRHSRGLHHRVGHRGRVVKGAINRRSVFHSASRCGYQVLSPRSHRLFITIILQSHPVAAPRGHSENTSVADPERALTSHNLTPVCLHTI